MRYKIHMIVFKLGYAYLDDIYHIIPCIPVWYTVITMLQIYMVRSPPVSYLAQYIIISTQNTHLKKNQTSLCQYSQDVGLVSILWGTIKGIYVYLCHNNHTSLNRSYFFNLPTVNATVRYGKICIKTQVTYILNIP